MAEIHETILNTSVTWSDFEKNLRAGLRTEARLGSNKSVIDIGDGVGFVSTCALITCDWVGAAADEELPNSVVLKIPSILPLRKMNDAMPEGQKLFNFGEEGWANMAAQINEIHNIEVATYNFIDEFDGLLMPKMYFGQAASPEQQGTICLEYMDNTQTMRVYERNSVEQVKQIARALGKIQACSLRKEPKDPALHIDFFKKMAEWWPVETFRGMFKGMAALDSSEKTTELMEKIDDLIPTYHGSNLATSICKQMGLRAVLVNGDLHTGNVLVDKDSRDVVSLIDWQSSMFHNQCTHLGVGVEDLHRIAMSALTTEKRRASMPSLIEEMYNSMVKHLDGVEAPYTLDTLLAVSDLVFPQCALFFASNFIAMITARKRDRDPTLSIEEKAARKEVMLDKVIGTLEDVVAMDLKNNNNIGNLTLRY